MSDIKLPEEVINWMESLSWGNHHVEYHVVKRWDIWHYRAQNGDPLAQQVVDLISANNWQRPAIQEGDAGDGVEFLSMHRAMLILVKGKFPEYGSLFQGWKTPPTEPSDLDDPATNGCKFEPQKNEAIKLIEKTDPFFKSEDHFGVFIETDIQAVKGNPDYRTHDSRFGVHNYLHNRWTDINSPVNLGDPSVNIFNARFWKLHGWVDNVWTVYRKNNGLSDNDSEYRRRIDYYLHMMSGHHHLRSVVGEKPNIFGTFFAR